VGGARQCLIFFGASRRTMKILVVSNIYPPHHLGGYELGCRDIVENLRVRGHAVQVLTSSFRNGDIETPPGEKGITRSLRFVFASGDPPHDKRAECRKLADAVKQFQPEVVYFSNQSGLCHWLPVTARRLGRRTAFFLSDPTFVSWRVGAWLARAAQKNSLVRKLFGETFLVQGWSVVKNQTCHFASDFLRNVALKNRFVAAGKDSVVTHWGIELSQFTAPVRARWPIRRLLYVGRLSPQKGVHTALAALKRLAEDSELSGLTLSLAGGGPDLEYGKKMRELAAQPGLAGRVHFLGERPRSELARIYAEHDALIFPSEWDEPFAITPLEAMASGLAVVGTTTGGSGELFRNRETAMTFAAGHAADCARAIRELCADRELFQKISRHAQREVRAKHTLDAMVDKIERSLLELI
jgi:glycogen synthase